jgi:predicted DNA-binding transcriptional regulator YafY
MKNTRDIRRRDLIKNGLDPEVLPGDELLHWLTQARHPVLACPDKLATLFIEAMLTGESVEFIYIGGTTPGNLRTVKVSLVFQHEPKGRIYVSGFCLGRSAHRVFALDLIMVIHAWN